MPKDIWPDDFHCPKCNKVPENNAILMPRDYSVYALRLPYFLCGDCRICSYDKELLRQCIARWKKNGKVQRASYRAIYQESKESLEKTLKYYMDNAGYHLGRFKRK